MSAMLRGLRSSTGLLAGVALVLAAGLALLAGLLAVRQMAAPTSERPDARPTDGPGAGSGGRVERAAPGGARRRAGRGDRPGPAVAAGPRPLPSRAQVLRRFAHRPPGRFGPDVPGMVRRVPARAGVVLTFDACGGPGGEGYDAQLIAELRRRDVPATLFLNRRWIRANPRRARRLAGDPRFEVASHGDRHVPLSVHGRSAYGVRGTADAGEAEKELRATDRWFRRRTGTLPAYFRPGTAHGDEAAAALARALRRPLVGFTVNADAGATASAEQVAGELDAVRRGDVVIAHMNRPEGATAEGFATGLARLRARGVRLTTLGRALGHRPPGPRAAPGAQRHRLRGHRPPAGRPPTGRPPTGRPRAGGPADRS